MHWPGGKEVEAECFSIQQNFWLSDSNGNVALWVQNVVELAELEGGPFFATYAFLVWTPTEALQPLYCFPSSYADNLCRTPIFTYPLELPHSFTFYANLSRVNEGYALYVSNDLAAQSWSIPASIDCPCFIDTVRQQPLPWGFYPFEFVVVGLDNGSTAFFENGTSGSVGPAMVQLVGGDWHLANMNTLRCDILLGCLNAMSTMESSANLRWNNASGQIYWSIGGGDQGNYIEGIQAEVAEPPLLPRPAIESVLCIEMDSREPAIPTIFDDEGRATGYDTSSGHFVQSIPNSFVSSSTDLRIAIVNPSGSYRLTLNPIGSGPFRLLVSKEFNINSTKSINSLNGFIIVLTTEQYVIDSNMMAVKLDVDYAPMLTVIGIVLVWVTVIGGIAVWLKRRRSLNKNKDDW